MQIIDTLDLIDTLSDPCVSSEEQWLTLGLYVAGAVLPGGGYATGGKAVLHHADDVYDFVHWGEQVAGHSDEVLRRTDDVADEIRVVDDVVGLCSFSPDTLVATEDGRTPIGLLAAGTLVYAYNEGLGTTGLYTVTAVWAHDDPVLVTLTLDGERIETTPEHPFYVLLRGWLPAEALHAGVSIRKRDGTYGVVEAVRVEYQTRRMYNLTVATAHTFFVGEDGWLVHNVCLQTGGHTMRNSTARALNREHGLNLHPRDWGRALEALKKDLRLGNNHHGKIMDTGAYLDGNTEEYLGNLLEYLP